MTAALIALGAVMAATALAGLALVRASGVIHNTDIPNQHVPGRGKR